MKFRSIMCVLLLLSHGLAYSASTEKESCEEIKKASLPVCTAQKDRGMQAVWIAYFILAGTLAYYGEKYFKHI